MLRPLPIALVCLAAGCGDPLVRAQLADTQKRLDESQRRQAQAEKKLESLEDRVFLLTDQVESQKVAQAHTGSPRLPVVTLRPTEETVAASDEQGDVEYRGDASSPTPDKARTVVLHMDGTRHEPLPVKKTAPRPPARPAPLLASSTDNLGVAPAPDVKSVRDPLRLYKDSYEALRAGHDDQAARGFREFVKKFPHHDYADNAQYWLGECFYDRKMYPEAAAEFRRVVTEYPLGNKAPDALLKLGFSVIASGEAQKGRQILSEVPKSYPRTEAARLAEQRLGELGRVEATP
jgi:tol-pal system protein YbgF